MTLKILRVASDIYPDMMGGLGIHAHEMSRLQAELGHKVTVLTSDGGNRNKQSKEVRNGYQVIRHRELVSPLDNSIFPGLVKTLVQLAPDYDVIHAHSHLFFSTNITAAYRQIDHTPLIVTNHGLISQTAPKWLQKVYIPTVARFTLNSADRVLCYSQTDKRRLRERGVDSDINVIHNGIDCDTFTPQERTGEHNLQVLFVGRLKPGKGVNLLLNAFMNVANKIENVKLKIVGDGPLKKDLVQTVESADIHSKVEFAGQIPNDEMPEVYAESDVFVLPSKNEGLPRTVLEAMACRTPVIVSNLPQLKPLIGSAGVMINNRSEDQFANAILDLLKNKNKRNRMGAIGRETVQQSYSWQETVRKTNTVYTELLNERGYK